MDVSSHGSTATSVSSDMSRPPKTSSITAEGTRLGAFARIDWALFAFCGLIWGSSFYFIAVGVDHFSPPLIAALRLGLGTAVLAVAPRARGPVARADLPRIALLALVWMAIPFCLFPIAEQWVDSAVAGIINAGTPVFTAILAVSLLQRSLARRQVAGLLLGLVGVIVVALPSLGEGGSSLLGIALLVLAAALYAVALTLAVPLQQRYGALPVMMRTQGVAFLMTLPFAIWGVGRSDFAWSSLAAVTVLGIAGTGLALLAMAVLTGRVGATRASTVTYLFPVVAIALGVLFRGEPLHVTAIIGTVLVVGGAALVSRAERSR
jgi:drug/metabolite transporter (DMT)-like permease